jgi:S-DNA-T family DNA segregation ATPase FtsK/SpoIIIE
MGLAMIGLSAQHPRANPPRMYLIHSALADTPDGEFLEAAAKGRAQISQGHEAPEFIAEIHAEMKRRNDEGSAGDPPIYLFVHGLQKFRKLRHEEDFSFGGDDTPKPGNQLNDIIAEGPPVGIHLITSLDTLNNINRCLNRKSVSELGMRVLFQMSANDSASLIDSPKASTLGPAPRALLQRARVPPGNLPPLCPAGPRLGRRSARLPKILNSSYHRRTNAAESR